MDLPNIRDEDGTPAIPVTPIARTDLSRWRDEASEAARTWADGTGFEAAAGQVCLIPGGDGDLAGVLFGVGDEAPLWAYAGLPAKLPARTFRIDAALDPAQATDAALGWQLGCYAFRRYKKETDAKPLATLVRPDGCDPAAVGRAASATYLVRDLVNTPANDMGPEELAEAARTLAESFGATFRTIVGDALLDENYPAIHAVGQASPRAPRLIDFVWGDPSHPKVTLVGKGVCFDTGGLDLKPSGAMLLMKKDMGGAAHVLGLARMIMMAGLPVRLRVLIPAVENSVAGNAMRPLDVLRTRKGLTVEVGNTDAEGRLVLCDALAEADGEDPDLIVDFATLTGAARVALGPDLPALFTNDDGVADALAKAAARVTDPVWRLPLWQGYRKGLDSKVADLNNVSPGPYAGAITAALFLEAFVSKARPWVHLDVMAWNTSAKPGRPEGGEALGMRAVYAMIEERYASGR